MPEVHFGKPSYNSDEIFKVSVKALELISALENVPGIFVFDFAYIPLLDLLHFFEAHDHVKDNIFVFKTVFSALYDGLADVQVGEGTTISQLFTIQAHHGEDRGYTGSWENGVDYVTVWNCFVKDD